jgi:hypothetical protein
MKKRALWGRQSCLPFRGPYLPLGVIAGLKACHAVSFAVRPVEQAHKTGIRQVSEQSVL